MDKKFMLIITGPTGVGKTDFALEVARRISSEIINIDVGQFYSPLNIGTAKPDWQKETIKHNFFDIIGQPKDLTALEYRNLLENKLKEIWNNNKLPILVGGSGFYIQSLLFPPKAKTGSWLDPDTLFELRRASTFDIKNSEELWEELNKVDEVRARQIDKNDIYRINRALEIWENTGIKPSQYMPDYKPICDYELIILSRDRQELYQRINKRVIEMINLGWIDEVKNLDKSLKEFLKIKKLIGYDDIINYLELNNNLEEADKSLLIEIIQKKTRNYAKRQITFIKSLINKIINAEDPATLFELRRARKENIKKLKLLEWINLDDKNFNEQVCKLVQNLDFIKL